MAVQPWPAFRGDNEKSLTKAIAILKELAGDFSDVPDYQFALSETYALGEFGGPRFSKQRFQTTETRLKEALRLSEELVANHPNVPDYVASKANIHHKLAGHLRWTKLNDRSKESETHLKQAVTLQSQLTKRFPAVYYYHISQMRYVLSLVDHWNRQRRYEESETKLKAMIAPIDAQLKENKSAKTLHFPLFMYYSKLAKTLRSMKRFDEADAAQQQAQRFTRFRPGPPLGGQKKGPRKNPPTR